MQGSPRCYYPPGGWPLKKGLMERYEIVKDGTLLGLIPNAPFGSNDMRSIYWFGCVDMGAIKKLLEAGADTEERDLHGGTPLLAAVIIRGTGFPLALPLVELLLDHGADIDADNFGTTPLARACESGRYDIAKLLLSRGASVHGRHTSGVTAFSIACKHATVSGHERTTSIDDKYENSDFSKKTSGPWPSCKVNTMYIPLQRYRQYYFDVVRALLARGAGMDGAGAWSTSTGGGPCSAFVKARNDGCPEVRAIIRAHLARAIRATAKRSQVWAPRVASFLI